MAQLVRAPPCHGGGRGFESRSWLFLVKGVSIFLREISTSVVHGLPKPVRRVRLPYLAQNISNPGLNPGLLGFINIFSAFYSNKITFFELLHKYN